MTGRENGRPPRGARPLLVRRRSARLRYVEGTTEIEISVHLDEGGSIGDASALRARIESLGGRVRAHDRLLTARLPLDAERTIGSSLAAAAAPAR